MRKRLPLTLLLCAELTAGVLFYVALRFGRFDLGAFFYLYLLVPLAVLCIAIGIIARVNYLRRAGSHGLLLLGCIAFALPFVWLVSTSFKYEEEVFVYPPKWIPQTPGVITKSPYVTSEEFPSVSRPRQIEQTRWESLKPRVQNALWEKAFPFLRERISDAPVDSAQLRAPMVQGLWQSGSGRFADAIWSDSNAQIIAAFSKVVDREATDSTWESMYRSVEVKSPTITDIDGIERKADIAWRPAAANAKCNDSATSSRCTLSYDLAESAVAPFVATVSLPCDSDRFVSLRLPIREDRSWNRIDVAIEFAGKRYALEDELFLGQRRWQELTFKLKEKDSRDERDVGNWPIILAKNQAAAFDEPGKLQVSINIDRASAPAAAWRKYTNNYVQAYLTSGQRWRYVWNSLYLVALTVIGQLLSCSMVSYAFARIRWPGRDLLFLLLLATMMLPGQVTMVPTFLIFKSLGWYNTLKALWVPSFLGSAFFIFMMRQFMKSIPNELEEAARIDGCGFFGIYWRIILPLMKPALAAVAIFTFMGTWNEFMAPLIYINDQRLYPLSLGLFDFRTQHGAEYGMLMAASTLMTLPVIALFFLAQRYFIQGITLTGMKA